MSYVFTTAEQNTIISLREQARNGDIAYGDVYDYLATIGETETGIDAASISWLRGAAKVNRGEGVASEFIRTYTAEQ